MEIYRNADTNNIIINGKPQRIESTSQMTGSAKTSFLSTLSNEELYRLCSYYNTIPTNESMYDTSYFDFRTMLIERMSDSIEFTSLMLLDIDAPTDLGTVDEIRSVSKYRRAVITDPYIPGIGIYIDNRPQKNNGSVRFVAKKAFEFPGELSLETLMHSGLELSVLHDLIVQQIYANISNPEMRDKVVHALYLIIQIAAHRSSSKKLLLPIGVNDLILALNIEVRTQNGENVFIPSYEVHNPIFIPLDLITEIVKAYSLFLIALAHNLADKGEYHYDLISFDGHSMIERLLPIKGQQGQFRELFGLTVKLYGDRYTKDEIKNLRQDFESELKKLTEYYTNVNQLTIDGTESLGRKGTGFINATGSNTTREKLGVRRGKKLVTKRWSSSREDTEES